MASRTTQPTRIHLISHAVPPRNDIRHFGFDSAAEYIAFIREHTPAPYRITGNRRLMELDEDEWHSGRRDDAARVRDLQNALADPHTLAIVATNGGAYFSRILPHVNFDVLKSRRTPIWSLGFSEMSTIVNFVASYRCGRGLYWLCPNYTVWKVRPLEAARALFGEFWQTLPGLLQNGAPEGGAIHLDPIRGKLVRGRVQSGRVRMVGGCLAVVAAAIAGPLGRRMWPNGHWLFLEDVGEVPYRTDRHLAALKFAGWFERIAGVLVGDFHAGKTDAQDAVVDLLNFHLPAERQLPVVTTKDFGHVWPLTPVPVNMPVDLEVRGRDVTFRGSVHRK